MASRTRRSDAVTWLAAIAVGAVATAIAVAAGARLGAGLTLGVILVIAIVLGRLGIEARRRPSRPDTQAAPPPKGGARVPTSARAKRRKR